jgi:hypothetical protein
VNEGRFIDSGYDDMVRPAHSERIEMHGDLRLSQEVSASNRLPIFRALVVMISLAILFWRMPTLFTNPQFWAEDSDLFLRAYFEHWQVLSTPVAGYLVSIQTFVAAAASFLPPVAAPFIYNYTAVLLTLVTVWLSTSPRFDMPYKPLIAVAIIVVPMGYEELGTITNIQWVLPIGAFALLFTSAAPSRVALLIEMAFTAAMAFSGPFSIFLAPLFAWQTAAAPDRVNRNRLLVLTMIVLAGAATQTIIISQHQDEVINPVAASPYSWMLWFTMPLTKLLTTFDLQHRALNGPIGVGVALLLAAAVTALSLLRPYQKQKLFMIIFATAITLSGMYKFRAALGGQIYAQRYFYVGSVFSIWFLCCLASNPRLRPWPIILVAFAEIISLRAIKDTPRIADDLQWVSWAGQISSGLPLLIPSSPAGFYIAMPASPQGQLAGYLPLMGRKFTQLAEHKEIESCGWMVDPTITKVLNIRSTPYIYNVWTTGGDAWDIEKNSPVDLVVLADSDLIVVGFGFAGFKSNNERQKRAGWKAMLPAPMPPEELSAFAILKDTGSICSLGKQAMPGATGPSLAPNMPEQSRAR